jgi:hypothetical protein
MSLSTAGYPTAGYPSLHIFGGWTAKPSETRRVTPPSSKQTVSGSLPQWGVTGCNRRLGNHGQPKDAFCAHRGLGPRSDDVVVRLFLGLPQDVSLDRGEVREAAAIDRASCWKRRCRRVHIARRPRGLDFNDLLIGRLSGFEESGS